MRKLKNVLSRFLTTITVTAMTALPAMAASPAAGSSGGSGSGGNVASVVEQTWQDAAGQIKTVMDNVVFPALAMVLGIAFFCKLAMAFFDYRNQHKVEFTGPIILFACLVFVLTAPLYIWTIIGI